MAPVVNAPALSAFLGSLPQPAQEAVRTLARDEGWPKLTDPSWDPANLYAAALDIEKTVRATGFVAWALPLDVSVLGERIAALPDDLRDLAADNVGIGVVPRLDAPERWTVEHWDHADQAITHAEGLAQKRHRHVMALIGDWPDERRHLVLGIITGGRCESSKKLTGPEVRHLAAYAETLAAGLPIEWAPYAPDWKAEAKRLGCTQADLLAEAKAWSKARQLPGVMKLAELGTRDIATDFRVIAHVLLAADDGENMMENTAAEAATMPAPTPAEEVVELAPLPAEAVDDPAILPPAEVIVTLEEAREQQAWPAEVDHAVLDRLAALERTVEHLVTLVRQNGENGVAVLALMGTALNS